MEFSKSLIYFFFLDTFCHCAAYHLGLLWLSINLPIGVSNHTIILKWMGSEPIFFLFQPDTSVWPQDCTVPWNGMPSQSADSFFYPFTVFDLKGDGSPDDYYFLYVRS